jgi:hypothetical protein
MKLAKIILPITGNDGQLLERVHLYVRLQLIEKWNGFTVYDALGGWKRDDDVTLNERVKVYEIAMSLADVQRLRVFASQIARDAKQDCVMMVTPNGDVEFVQPRVDDEPEAA